MFRQDLGGQTPAFHHKRKKISLGALTNSQLQLTLLYFLKPLHQPLTSPCLHTPRQPGQSPVSKMRLLWDHTYVLIPHPK